jgi:uncharacterized Zn finger protein
MAPSGTKSTEQPSTKVLSSCPQCHARLVILRVIAGSAGAEYWTLRCTSCGGIHLDIVKPGAPLSTEQLT